MNMMRKLTMVSLTVVSLVAPTAVYGDAISPSVTGKGKTYSKEQPDVNYYGTGIGGRFCEASMLRMEADRLLQDGSFAKAVTKAKKAVQLDPSDSESHMLMARAMTRQFYAKSGAPDEKLLSELMPEWKMLWLHNAESTEQAEAKFEYLKLLRISRAIAKRKKLEVEARARAREERDREELAGLPPGDLSEEENSDAAATDAREAEGGGRKKRFKLF